MFLTVHAAAGLVIGKYIHNPLLAFLAGFLSHLFLDFLPHDPLFWKKWRAKENFKFFFFVMFVEAPLMIIIGAYLLLTDKLIMTWPTLWALLGAIILDFLTGLDYLFPQLKIFAVFNRLNLWLHDRLTNNYHFPWYIWLPIQLSFLVVFLIIYIS
jgi:hypothetical protein